MEIKCFKSYGNSNNWECHIIADTLPIFTNGDDEAEIRFEGCGPTKEVAKASAVSLMKDYMSDFINDYQDFLKSL